jgi:hypothetical protein
MCSKAGLGKFHWHSEDSIPPCCQEACLTKGADTFSHPLTQILADPQTLS